MRVLADANSRLDANAVDYVLLAVAAAFLTWAMVRPLRIPEPDPEPAEQPEA